MDTETTTTSTIDDELDLLDEFDTDDYRPCERCGDYRHESELDDFDDERGGLWAVCADCYGALVLDNERF